MCKTTNSITQIVCLCASWRLDCKSCTVLVVLTSLCKLSRIESYINYTTFKALNNMARQFVYLRRCVSLVTSAMALKLISTLAILVLASFAYKVWDKTKVPAEVAKDDVWKVKTIDFSCRCVHKIVS